MKINIIILKYSRLSKEADEVLFIIDFTPNIIIWLNEIVVKRAIASLFPILVFSIMILSCKKYYNAIIYKKMEFIQLTII